MREIKALLALMQEYGLTELELDDKRKGRLRLVRASAPSPLIADPGTVSARSPQNVKAARHVSARVAKAGDSVAHPSLSDNQRLVTSPMVGTFYRASSPDASPYVEEGDSVRKGQTLCIIEAMKMMNEIEAEMAGRIVSVLCENAQAVEYGQPLMVIEVG
ncbi:MAG TPA: acetyl-CoA carboxylase biotin carboxyl carrier protein [Candidatus Binataceae bacterium]|nr:acetyl-CoA carboxylase biotin carboxyl carrier protein [Candidatus Binataceae bacterium]